MHRSTYRKRENLIQNLNQRTPSIVEYQTGRTTYIMMKICTGDLWEDQFLSMKIITFLDKTLLIKIVVTENVKVINSTLFKKSLAYFYPCRSVSKTSPLLCPFTLPQQGRNLRDQENSQ